MRRMFPAQQARRKRRNQRKRRRKRPMSCLPFMKMLRPLSQPHQRIFLQVRLPKLQLDHLQRRFLHPMPRSIRLHTCRHPHYPLSLPSRSRLILTYRNWVHRRRRLSPVPTMRPSSQIKGDSSRSSVPRTRRRKRMKMIRTSTRSSHGFPSWVKKRQNICTNSCIQRRMRSLGP